MTTREETLDAENAELKRQLNETKRALHAEQIKRAYLQDAIDGMASDISLMESRINELEGKTPFEGDTI